MIQFKHTLYSTTLAVIIAVGLVGCEKEQIIPDGSTLTPMAVTITDEGYNDLEASGTRTTEDGYRTTFTTGDQVGLYAVKSGALAATNVCLTLANVSGSMQWQPPTNVKLPSGANYYFAYYPYKASPKGSVTASATTATEFFADIISAWTLATDQSGTKYTAADLMVGMGTLGSTSVGGVFPLNVTLVHQMGLAVIKLPSGATDARFTDFTPYGVSGEYRYLLKPSTETTLKGSFVNGGEYRGYTIPANVAGGNYRIYTVK